MDIAFIISTANAAKHIGITLEQFRAVRHLRYEVIVSDNGSNDQTKMIAQAAGAKVKALPHSIPGTINSCRNRGAAATTADILWFCSPGIKVIDLEPFADEVVHYFRAHLETVALVPYVTDSSTTKNWRGRIQIWYSNACYYFLNQLVNSGSAPEGCMIVRRSAFEKVHGFDPTVIVNGQSDLARRLVKLGKVRLIWHRRIIVSSVN